MSAYLLVLVIGSKLLVDWTFNDYLVREHSTAAHAVDFHSPGSPGFWIFWGLMAAGFAIGFLPKRVAPDASENSATSKAFDR
jgi:hypothetical protein